MDNLIMIPDYNIARAKQWERTLSGGSLTYLSGNGCAVHDWYIHLPCFITKTNIHQLFTCDWYYIAYIDDWYNILAQSTKKEK